MSEEFHSQEEALKDYLAEEQCDAHNTRNSFYHKYNNLKIYIDPKKYQEPHFIVRIGISECVYQMADGKKISGGLGSDERYVRRWIDRNLNRMNLGVAWKESKKVKQVKVNPKDLDE